jgi:hypothetical protein
MRVYTSGRTDAPAILLLPGTCCDWESNFGKVIPLLSREFHITRESVKNQFYSDLITPLPMHIDPPYTEIHILYATKMGEKYRKRYTDHFAHPILHEQDLQHEELLVCYPEQWAALVTDILNGKSQS